MLQIDLIAKMCCVLVVVLSNVSTALAAKWRKFWKFYIIYMYK